MRAQYKFGFIEENDMQILSTLIRKSLAKHMLGINNPSPGQMRQIPNSYMPKRDEDSTQNAEK